MPSFVESPDGVLYIADGRNAPRRWDGLTAQIEKMGLDAPTSTPAMAGVPTGGGALAGTYYAYLRFVDRFGFVSDLSPISTETEIKSSTLAITKASNSAPIRITTSTVHGLATGNKVNIYGVGGNTKANGQWTVTVLTTTTFSLNNSSGNGAHKGNGTVLKTMGSIRFSNLQVPTDSKVVRRQILRNTDGQALTFYVDIDTTDLTSTTLDTTKDDSTLSAGTAVPLFDTQGRPLANRHGVPPNHKTILAAHLGKLWMAGEFAYEDGSVKVTINSKTVTGVGTAWTTAFEGRFLYVVGSTRSYEIDSVDVVNQTLLLLTPYQDSSTDFGLYAIRPTPAERKLVYWSESGLPESWQATSAIAIEEEGGEITGLMPMRGFLYILERRHCHKLTFQDDPALDGAVFFVSARGCVNNNCWVQVDDVAYMLDDYGVHRFAGTSQSEHLSTPIQSIFQPGSNSEFKINWSARKYFHASLYRPQETIRWFVTMDGQTYPRHAICYQYRAERWWIEEYQWPIGGSSAGESLQQPAVFLGCPHRKVFSLWQGTLDTVDAGLGTVTGEVTGSDILSLTDSLATFPATTILGAPLVITDGKGRGQVRKIVARDSATKLRLDSPWLILPDTTSTYQIGGIPWRLHSAKFRLSAQESYQDRAIEVCLTPSSGFMGVEHFYGASAQVMKVAASYDAGGGVRTRVDESINAIDMTRDIVRTALPSTRTYHSRGIRYYSFELSGVTGAEETRVGQVLLEGFIGNE